MATSAFSLPCPVSAPLHERVRHCGRGALGCDECLAVLALCLATEMKFDEAVAWEMSLESYLAALEAGHLAEPEARELRRLTAGLCTGIDLMAQGEQDGLRITEVPKVNAPPAPLEAGEAPEELARCGPDVAAVVGLWIAIAGCAAALVATVVVLAKLAMGWRG